MNRDLDEALRTWDFYSIAKYNGEASNEQRQIVYSVYQ